MKNICKYIALVCATAMLVGITACAKTETPEITGDVNETDSITVAVETSASSESEETTTVADEETEPEIPVTNEAGELTIDGATFETMYGSQLGNYLNHQYYYDDIAIPIAESNFYFIHEFIDLSNQAYRLGYYPLTSEGFVDLSYAFENGTIGTFSFDCFGDYFRESAESQIISTYIVLDFANEAGVELSDETEAEIQGYMETLAEGASMYGLTLDEYLKIFYGPDCTRDVFVGILERYYLTTVYSDEYVANYGFTDEELYVPRVCHALFMSLEGSASEEEDQIASEAAYGMLEQCKTAADVTELGNALLASGTVAECASYDVQKDVFVPEFEDWAYDESRQVDDVDVVKTYYGYHVIGYMGLVELSDEAKTEIALKALNDEIGAIAFNNVHDFYTPDDVVTPDPVDPNANIKDKDEEEVVPTLNLDESGNIVVETSESITENVITVVPEEITDESSVNSAKTTKTIGVVAIIVGVIALVAAACFGFASVAKGKKIEIDDQDEKKESSDSEEEDDASEE